MKWDDLERDFDRTFGLGDIDEFISLLGRAIDRQLDALDEEAKGLIPEKFEDPEDLDLYRDHLNDRALETEAVRALADELSVMALMKKVELRLNAVLTAKVPTCLAKDKIGFGDYRKALGDAVYDMLPGKKEFRELLLLCNCIKHNGVVSEELAIEIPGWAEGADLKGLDAVYSRLRTCMIEFVFQYVTAIYAAHPRPARKSISP